MPRIYISHRPEDSSRNEVAMICERLIAEFGAENILQSTGSNMEITTNLQRLVQSCDVLLVVVGRYWSNMVDERGNFLLEDPYDPIHVEIDAGLKSTMVVAVLVVDDAPIPTNNQLPEVLQPMLKKVMLEASDHAQLDRVLDELIPLWEAISTEDLDTDEPVKETIIEEAISEPETPISPERAQAVLAANPPYQPPAQRRSPRSTADTPENQSQSSNSSWIGLIIGLGIVFVSFIFNALDNGGNSSSRSADAPAAVVSVNYPEDVRFDRLFTYDRDVADVRFSPAEHTLFTYEPLNDSHIWFIDLRSKDQNPESYPHDEDKSRAVFEDITVDPSNTALDETEIAEFESQMFVNTVFSAIDWSYLDNQVVILSEEGVVFLLDEETLDLKSSHIIEYDKNREYIGYETVVYDATHNLLMLLTDDNQISIWFVKDDVQKVGDFKLDIAPIQQLAVNHGGHYLAARTADNVLVYEINIDD